MRPRFHIEVKVVEAHAMLFECRRHSYDLNFCVSDGDRDACTRVGGRGELMIPFGESFHDKLDRLHILAEELLHLNEPGVLADWLAIDLDGWDTSVLRKRDLQGAARRALVHAERRHHAHTNSVREGLRRSRDSRGPQMWLRHPEALLTLVHTQYWNQHQAFRPAGSLTFS
eukprot:scaffold467_cov403-Prasinococcus_capsulatus_cf.AAC.4